MAGEFAPDNRWLRHPIQLHRPALANMRPMPVKRTGAAAKRQHGPGERHDLSHIIINVIGTMQQAQAALKKVPIGVEIEQ